MSKILWVIVGLPVGIVLIALGVANREPLTVSLDPFRPTNPALAIHPPLFIAFFAVLAAGVLIGGIAMWISQHRVRSALNRARLDLQKVRQERDQLLTDRATAAGSRGGVTSGRPGLPAIGSPRRVA